MTDDELIGRLKYPFKTVTPDGTFLSMNAEADMQQAANRIRELKAELEELRGTTRYGCHVDLFDGEEPDGCVLDEGHPEWCVYAQKYGDKTKCPYWKPINARQVADAIVKK